MIRAQTFMQFQNTPQLDNILKQSEGLFQKRFDPCYWPLVCRALQTADLHHSVVLMSDQTVCACAVVCPPEGGTRALYKGASFRCAPPLEVAFVATDPSWEGRGLARRLMSEVLLCCTTTQQGCWLHVDLDNTRAYRIYESHGFRIAAACPDPFGSMGYLMTWDPWGENTRRKEGAALLNACPRETEQALCRGVLAPPGMAGVRHALPCFT
jgi:GNAT superfamily N-acetyltransferase